ncbi:amino acid adenylation domain-containing protein [Aquimarina addita]|uniref:amino acid adenylation domain-containing protein n=1 Tax=Aquimarina addita TaxID=870485 RepID=UPI0031ECEF12
MLSAFKVLLYRYSGQVDICVGTPIANRTQEELEGLIGFFVNILALRSDLSGNPSFNTLLSQIKEMTLQAYDHQQVPFEKVVDQVVVTRDMSTTPLFQVKFMLNNIPKGRELEFEGLSLSPYEVDEGVSTLDLEFNIIETHLGISLNIDYCTDLYDQTTIEHMAVHYRELLFSITDNPDMAIGDLSMLTPKEEHQLLKVFNNTQVEYPKDKTVIDLFEEQVKNNPEHIAVVFDNKKLTYKELNEKSNRLAHHLKEKYQLNADDFVTIMLNRSEWCIISILGILKAGASYVPIDIDYPNTRKLFIVEDTKSKVLIIESESLFDVINFKINIFSIDIELDELPNDNSFLKNPSFLKSSNDLAYIIYTSGSTGNPKGVMIEHKGLLNLILYQINLFRINSTSNILLFASLSFDASCSEIFTSLLGGASLIIPKKEKLLSINLLIELINQFSIDIVTLPPSYQALLENEDNIANLKTIISAGESLNIQAVKSFQSNGIRVINFYGPTESTIGVTMSEDPIIDNDLITIGKPIANIEIHILDKRKKLVPNGVIGEIFIGGIGVARGYLNLPDLTKSKFVNNPFSEIPGTRLYKTGDLGKRLKNGNIIFLGRKDEQIKLRGYRIELEEIKNTILNYDKIKNATVIAENDEQGNSLLKAYFTKRKMIKLRASISEYFVYDDLAYHSLTGDTKRNSYYKRVFKKHIKGKVVLDIGSGPDAILSKLCIEAGAKKVYSVEISKDVYLKAKKHIHEIGLSDKIILINDNITEVNLPEKVDFCVSEIVGPIGGSEGSAKLINMSRKLLKSPEKMIPKRSLTKIAGVYLPDNLHDFQFDDLGKHYVEKIFDQVGYKFDLRLCIEDFPIENVITNHQNFEDLNYTRALKLEGTHSIRLEFNKTSIVTGFIIWLNLFIDDDEIIDTLSEKYSWLPVYIPVFYDETKVNIGDYIEANIVRTLSDNGLNPDFIIKGKLYRMESDDVEFNYRSSNHEKLYRHNRFYEKLFVNDTVNLIKSKSISSTELRTFLKSKLPEYMIPGSYIELEALPINNSGKVDKKRLLSLNSSHSYKTEYIAPRNEMEEKLTSIWKELLNIENISVDDDFFELGGHSLLATRLISMIRNVLKIEIAIKDIFEFNTIEDLALFLEQIKKPISDDDDEYEMIINI